jgi:hypothetical protein
MLGGVVAEDGFHARAYPLDAIPPALHVNLPLHHEVVRLDLMKPRFEREGLTKGLLIDAVCQRGRVQTISVRPACPNRGTTRLGQWLRDNAFARESGNDTRAKALECPRGSLRMVCVRGPHCPEIDPGWGSVCFARKPIYRVQFVVIPIVVPI